MTKVIIEAMRPIDGGVLVLPLVSASIVANTMYHVDVVGYPTIDNSYNVMFTLKTRYWTLKVPAAMSLRFGNANLGYSDGALIDGDYDRLKHDLTLAAMFLND